MVDSSRSTVQSDENRTVPLTTRAYIFYNGVSGIAAPTRVASSSSIRLSRSRRDDPPFATAALATTDSSMAFFLAVSPSPPAFMNPDTALAIASPGTTVFSCSATLRCPSHTRFPAPATSTTSLSLMNCSNTSGHVSIGFPAVTASRTEFHPQWLRNAPTALWARMATCGAHPLTTRPRPATLSSHPSG
ncbi:hypothetical protein BHM03_00062011, partial [Ensete ventricosum]